MSRLARRKEKGNLAESPSKWETKKKHEELESLAGRTELPSFLQENENGKTNRVEETIQGLITAI